MQLQKPKNQYALTLRLLIQNKSTGVTMKQCCAVLLYKFQTRLLEIEKSLDRHGKPRHLSMKIRRLPMTKKNQFGHSMTFTNYKSLAPTSYLIALHNKLNKHGLLQPKK